MSTTIDKSTVRCPTCKAPTPWNPDNPFRPFCSETCKNKDFIDWANEEKNIPGNSVYDDVLSDDLEGY